MRPRRQPHPPGPEERHRRHFGSASVAVHEISRWRAPFHGPRLLARYAAAGRPLDTPTLKAAA
jgi:hypothetical protein